MSEIQAGIQWETNSRQRYEKMISIIPLFHRGIAKEVVDKKAVINAQERGADQIEEGDIVRAFFTEVPKSFYSLMIRIMDEVGFDSKKYE